MLKWMNEWTNNQETQSWSDSSPLGLLRKKFCSAYQRSLPRSPPSRKWTNRPLTAWILLRDGNPEPIKKAEQFSFSQGHIPTYTYTPLLSDTATHSWGRGMTPSLKKRRNTKIVVGSQFLLHNTHHPLGSIVSKECQNCRGKVWFSCPSSLYSTRAEETQRPGNSPTLCSWVIVTSISFHPDTLSPSSAHS